MGWFVYFINCSSRGIYLLTFTQNEMKKKKKKTLSRLVQNVLLTSRIKLINQLTNLYNLAELKTIKMHHTSNPVVDNQQ